MGISKIIIDIIPQKEQKVSDVGDYYSENGTVFFRVTDMKDSDYEMEIILHELIERHFNQKKGIKDEVVDTFDSVYKGPFKDEPGMDPRCPYHEGHMKAKALCSAFLLMCGKDPVIEDSAIDCKINEGANSARRCRRRVRNKV